MPHAEADWLTPPIVAVAAMAEAATMDLIFMMVSFLVEPAGGSDGIAQVRSWRCLLIPNGGRDGSKTADVSGKPVGDGEAGSGFPGLGRHRRVPDSDARP